MASSMAIDDHLAFTEDAAGTAEMFAQERASRVGYTASVASGAERKRGSYFKK